MALDKVVDSAVLDAGMMSVADAIRAKAGATEPLAWPDGFATAISGIETGGGGGGVSLDNVAVLIADYSDSNTYTVVEGAYYGTRRAICTI